MAESATVEAGEEARLWEIVTTGQVRVLLQPVLSLAEGRVVGYEALSRGPSGSPLEMPERLFAVGRTSHLLYSLERLCRRKAFLAKSRFLRRGEYLFLNVDPYVVYHASHQADITREVTAALGIDPREVVLELTERSVINDYFHFARALFHYTGHGFRVAVDDVGAGYANLRLIAEVKPDFIKVDMSLVRGINADQTKQALMETLTALAGKVRARVVAEGVETAAELETLIRLGVDCAQGYFIACPAETPPPVSREAHEVLDEARRRREPRGG